MLGSVGYLNFSNAIADCQLHGRACRWDGVIRNCFSGMQMIIDVAKQFYLVQTLSLLMVWCWWMTDAVLLIGKMFGNWKDSSHKEGFARQKIQEP